MLALFPIHSTHTHAITLTHHSRGQFNSGSHLVLSLFRLHHTHSDWMPHELFTIGQNSNTSLFLCLSLSSCVLTQFFTPTKKNKQSHHWERENRMRRKNDNKTKRNGMENNQSSKLLSMTDACFFFALVFFHFLKFSFALDIRSSESKRKDNVYFSWGPTPNLFNLPNEMKKKNWNISTVNCWTLHFSSLSSAFHITQKTIQAYGCIVWTATVVFFYHFVNKKKRMKKRLRLIFRMKRERKKSFHFVELVDADECLLCKR